jgi:hypothetical protein
VTPTTPRLQHAVLKRRTPPGGHDDQLVDGYRPGLTPRNLVKNLSQGPIIHRPHPHQKRQRLLEFQAPSDRPRGTNRQALGYRLDRNTPQHVRSEGGDRSSTKPRRAPYCGCVFRDPSVCDRGFGWPARLQTLERAGGGTTRVATFTGPRAPFSVSRTSTA